MVSVELKGIHVVRMRLASGKVAEYHYAWRGGPRLSGEPGSADYITSFQEAHGARKTVPKGALRSIIAAFKAAPEYTSLGAHSLRAYASYLDDIEARFGDLPLAALEDPKVRRHFLAWRNSMAASPRKADYAVGVLKRVLGWAVENVEIAANHADRIGRLHKADRSDCIWSENDFAAFRVMASKELTWAVELAAHTGLRQGDLVRLAWTHYDGSSFALRTSKRGKEVLIPATKACRAIVGSIPKRQAVILTTERGKRPWTADGLRSSFNKACKGAGVRRTFHDLRRTAATNLLRSGFKASKVALIMGWEEDAVDTLKRKYVSRSAIVQDMLDQIEKEG